MIRKYHNHKLQTTPWHREEEPLNHHKTPGRQIKQSNQLSLPHQDDCNTRMDISNVQQNIEQLQTPTMGVTINKRRLEKHSHLSSGQGSLLVSVMLNKSESVFLLFLMNRLNKTESAVFLHCRFFLFMKDPFFQIIYRSERLSHFLEEPRKYVIQACSFVWLQVPQ